MLFASASKTCFCYSIFFFYYFCLRGNSFTIDAVRRFKEALQCSNRIFNKLALCGRKVKLADLSAYKFDVFFRKNCHIFITKYDFGDLSDHIAEM